MKVYDTLRKELVEFEPRDPPRVYMYVCGPTVYDSPHVGHARSAVAFDVIRRYLEYKGYDVVFARNYTDIDDKMIARAGERGITIGTLGKQYIAEYEAAMEALNVKPPVYAPRATHMIPEFIAFIEALIGKGHAYPRNGSVYFSVPRFGAYGNLSKKPQKEIADTLRRDSEEHADEKDDPRDFALWKAQKPGEPAWDSPWGPGRPGWHIECSVMSTKLLGETIDIHGGGRDLIFPHHENEIAQSEARSGKPFCKYWMHNGFVTIDQAKMSKSLGNFFTVQQVLEEYEAPALRVFLISAHYRNPVNYSRELLDQATKNWHTLRDAWVLASQAAGGVNTWHAAGSNGNPDLAGAPADVSRFVAEFEAAMDEDFNTPKAMAAVFSLARWINEHVAETGETRTTALVFTAYASMLGVLGFDARHALMHATGKSGGNDRLNAMIGRLVGQRNEERARKNFKNADEIRDFLNSIGIELSDGKDGTTWKVI